MEKFFWVGVSRLENTSWEERLRSAELFWSHQRKVAEEEHGSSGTRLTPAQHGWECHQDVGEIGKLLGECLFSGRFGYVEGEVGIVFHVVASGVFF